MNIAKIRNVKTPNRGTTKAAGLDFYVPKFDDDFIRDFKKDNFKDESDVFENAIEVQPHGRCKIPTGIKAEIPEGYDFIVWNKGGVSWKDRITNLAAVVDEDYQGEIFITLFNYSKNVTYIREEQKLIQLVLVPVRIENVVEVPEDKIHKVESERGSGAMGSTGVY